MRAEFLLKSKGGFLAIDALLAILALSVMTLISFSCKNSEAVCQEVLENKWHQITEKEHEIINSIEAGCGLGCLTNMDLR